MAAPAEAHGAKAAGSEQLAGVVEVEVLDGPHLMLPHVGGYDRALGRRLLDGVQDLSRGQPVCAVLTAVFPQGRMCSFHSVSDTGGGAG